MNLYNLKLFLIMVSFVFNIINLDRRIDRWTSFINQIDKNHINIYKRISAIDGKDIVMTREYSYLLRNYGYQRYKSVVAYAMTTINLWKELLMGDEEYMIICDDDIRICGDFERRFGEFFEILNGEKFDVCMFGYIVSSDDVKYTLSNLLDEKIVVDDLRDHKYYSGSFAYVISRHAADKLLKFIDFNGLIAPIDTMFLLCMRNHIQYINILGSIPRLVYTDVATDKNLIDSDIQRDKSILL